LPAQNSNVGSRCGLADLEEAECRLLPLQHDTPTGTRLDARQQSNHTPCRWRQSQGNGGYENDGEGNLHKLGYDSAPAD